MRRQELIGFPAAALQVAAGLFLGLAADLARRPLDRAHDLVDPRTGVLAGPLRLACPHGPDIGA